MSEQNPLTKKKLLTEIEQQWTALNAALDRLSEAQLTTIHDAQGWTAKNHIIHMTRWERSVVFFLQRRPRYEGLGIPEAMYLRGSEDETNAAIYEQTKDLPLSDALAQFRANHQQLLDLLEPLTDADLQKRYRAYLPDEPGEGDGPLALTVIEGNTAHHYTEHLGWIEALIYT